MKRTIVAAGCVALLVGIAPQSMAQQDRLGGQQEQPGLQRDQAQERRLGGQQRQAGEAGQIEEKLAAWLACSNRAEVELGQLAAEKASNPQVQQFAQRMVQEHSQLIQQLQQINPEIEMPDTAQAGRQPGQAGQQRLQQQAQQQAQQRTAQAQRAGGGAEDPLMRIGEEAAKNKLELTKTYLQDKQGQEFDKCYMGSQIAAHIAMLAELKAMQNAGSPQLQQIVSKASQSTQQHLQQAQQIAQSLEGGEGAAARLTRRPGQPGETPQRDQQDQPEQDR